jgi:hypothetical protein
MEYTFYRLVPFCKWDECFGLGGGGIRHAQGTARCVQCKFDTCLWKEIGRAKLFSLKGCPRRTRVTNYSRRVESVQHSREKDASSSAPPKLLCVSRMQVRPLLLHIV